MTENICDMKVNKQLVYRSGIDDGSLYGDLIDRDALYGRNVGSAGDQIVRTRCRSPAWDKDNQQNKH